MVEYNVIKNCYYWTARKYVIHSITEAMTHEIKQGQYFHAYSFNFKNWTPMMVLSMKILKHISYFSVVFITWNRLHVFWVNMRRTNTRSHWNCANIFVLFDATQSGSCHTLLLVRVLSSYFIDSTQFCFKPLALNCLAHHIWDV